MMADAKKSQNQSLLMLIGDGSTTLVDIKIAMTETHGQTNTAQTQTPVLPTAPLTAFNLETGNQSMESKALEMIFLLN